MKLVYKAVVVITFIAMSPVTRVVKPQQPTRENAAVLISDTEGAHHRTTALSPIREAHWSRTLDFQAVGITVVVDVAGNVISIEPYSGPKEFYAPALSEAKTWKYKPFLRNNQPVKVTFTEYIPILPEELLPTVHIPFPQIRDWNSLRITLTRTGCFGPCPTYKVEIHGDGSVIYTGTEYVAVEGQHQDHISREALLKLVAAFRAADYFSLRDEYMMSVTDNPTYTTSISFDVKTKSVTDYVGEEVGMPESVKAAEEAVDRIAGTEKWISGTDDTVASLEQEHFDFKSEQAASTLARVAGSGSIGCVRRFLVGRVQVNGKDDTGRTPLENAAPRGDAALIRLLLMNGAGKNDLRQKTQALFLAALRGDPSVVRLLIQSGGYPNGPVLIAAATSGMPQAVAEILRYHPPVNGLDEYGHTAIFSAAEWRGDDVGRADRAAVIRLLTRAGANLNFQDQGGNTALHEATDEDAARALIENGANLNIQNKYGETPLMTTVSDEVALLLIKAGADVSMHDNAGHTALDNAKQNKWPEVIKAILVAQDAKQQN